MKDFCSQDMAGGGRPKAEGQSVGHGGGLPLRRLINKRVGSLKRTEARSGNRQSVRSSSSKMLAVDEDIQRIQI